MKYDFIERRPSAEKYNYLREKVGWSTPEPQVVEKALPNSIYCITVLG